MRNVRCHTDTVRQVLHGVVAVFHFAAAVGVGQSIYELEHIADEHVGDCCPPGIPHGASR